MRILWLKTELLHPVDKGGKIRTYHMLKHLLREHEVTYLTLTHPGDARESFDLATEYCHRLVTVPHAASTKGGIQFYQDALLNLASPLPLALARYRSPAMQEAIARELRPAGGPRHDLLVCDFLTPSVNLRNGAPCPRLLFEHNVEAMIWQRHAEHQRGWAQRRYFRAQWRKMRRYERTACRQFDAVVAVSSEDRQQIEQEYGAANVYDVPTGVDTDYFTPSPARPLPRCLVFVGSMDWLPNEDAVAFFAEQVLPHVVAALPDVTLKVVGRHPTTRVRALAENHPQIVVTGGVDDVRPHLAEAAACIVPLRIGGGTRLKIYEAMAMGKPVISTSIGAEGLPVRAGAELLIADDPAAFARAVVETLSDEAMRERLGENARAAVCARFGWARVAADFSRICERVARLPREVDEMETIEMTASD